MSMFESLLEFVKNVDPVYFVTVSAIFIAFFSLFIVYKLVYKALDR